MSAWTSRWRGVAARFLQRLFRGGVGHLIDIDHDVTGVADQAANDRGANEAAATGQ